MADHPLDVLVADDEDTIRELMTFILQDHGCKVTLAVNGRDATEKAEDGRFDLVFLDIMMPELNGVEAFKVIHDRRPELPVVMVSGFGRQVEALKDEALELGALKFISKPFSIADIHETLDEVQARNGGTA